MQEVGKALESEVSVGGEGLSGLNPEVVVVLLDAVSPVRGGVVRWRKLICKVLQYVCTVTKGSC